MFLTLKSFSFDAKSKGFFSPSRPEFEWRQGVIVSQCDKCARSPDVGILDPNCTCGLYSSPNWEALAEYHKYENSVVVMMNTYGDSDIWSAPSDVKNGTAWVLRSWGLKVVHVVVLSGKLKPMAQQVNLLALDWFNKDVEDPGQWAHAVPLSLAEKMIQRNWMNTVGYDPYDVEHPYKLKGVANESDTYYTA